MATGSTQFTVHIAGDVRDFTNKSKGDTDSLVRNQFCRFCHELLFSRGEFRTANVGCHPEEGWKPGAFIAIYDDGSERRYAGIEERLNFPCQPRPKQAA